MTTTSAPRTPAIDALPAPVAAPRSAAATSLLLRLDDPRTAAALHDLLDNAELLAMLTTMVDELFRRGETITGNIASGIAEVVRDSAGQIDLTATLGELGGLMESFRTLRPTLDALQRSSLAAPATISTFDTLATALVDGVQEARPPAHKPGVRALLAELRDPDTYRGLSMLLSVARALGRKAGA